MNDAEAKPPLDPHLACIVLAAGEGTRMRSTLPKPLHPLGGRAMLLHVLDRLAEIGVLTPTRGGYDRDDVKIIEAIASFRAGGYEEALGFTVYDTLRYREALKPLVEEEVRALVERLAGEVEVERAMEIVAAGVEPLRELLGAMHSKLLLAELRRQRARK